MFLSEGARVCEHFIILIHFIQSFRMRHIRVYQHLLQPTNWGRRSQLQQWTCWNISPRTPRTPWPSWCGVLSYSITLYVFFWGWGFPSINLSHFFVGLPETKLEASGFTPNHAFWIMMRWQKGCWTMGTTVLRDFFSPGNNSFATPIRSYSS